MYSLGNAKKIQNHAITPLLREPLSFEKIGQILEEQIGSLFASARAAVSSGLTRRCWTWPNPWLVNLK